MRLNRDAVLAVLLLVLCGVFFAATFSIRETSYGTVGSELWPRVIIIFLTLCTLVYLVGALRQPPSEGGTEAIGGIAGFWRRYRNPVWCFAAFAAFLALLPWLGMLIGGILFVFAALTLMGGHDARSLAVHAAIAILTVGAMWAVFTFALRVILPEGELIRFW